MQDQKNKRLFISLVALIVITAIVYAFTLRENTIDVDKNIFRLDDLTVIDRVTLEGQRGKVELTYNGSRWKVNTEFDADRDLINLFFATIKQAEPKRPVSASIKDSLNNILEKSGVRVSLYAGLQKRKEFVAGGNATKTQAFFKDESTSEIYVMTIPGYRVYVSGIFELNENGWRDKTVFAFHWRNFQSLSVEYSKNPSDNFRVAMQQNAFGIEGLSKTDTVKLGAYMDNVFSLALDEYSSSGTLKDSLERLTPDVTITVTDIAHRNYVLRLFGSKSDQIPALLSDNQAIIINRKRILPLLRPKSFFQQK